MASEIREVLTADQQSLTLWCQGMAYAGFGISGTWTGTVSFFASYLGNAADTPGIRFVPLGVQTFPASASQQSTTANGNFWAAVRNAVAVQALFSKTTGSAVVVMAASNDSSWQDCFLATTSRFVSQKVSAGATNVITQAAQANRAWRLRSLSVGFSVVAAAAVDLQISDGASSVLWEGSVPLGAGASSGGGTWQVPLPPVFDTPGQTLGGLVTTPGNSCVITLAAPGGSVASTLNAEFQAA